MPWPAVPVPLSGLAEGASFSPRTVMATTLLETPPSSSWIV